MNDEEIDAEQAAAGEPAAERVTVALCAAIATVAQARGDWADLKVTRPVPGDPEPVEHASVQVVLDTEAKQGEGTSYGIEHVRATYALICDVVVPESKRATPIERWIHRLKADIKRGVLRDFAAGGLANVAIEVAFGDAELLAVEESSHAGRVLLMVSLDYRTREDDPYVLLNEPQ